MSINLVTEQVDSQKQNNAAKTIVQICEKIVSVSWLLFSMAITKKTAALC